MACVIIQEAGQPNRIYHLPKREIIIGRGRDADLILPHTTVSKKHASLSADMTDYSITNISKGNTVLVDGSSLKGRITIGHKSKIQLGKYTLVFLGNNLSPIDQFFDGRALDEIPLYARTSQANRTDATFQLSPGMVKKTLKQGNLIRNARIKSGDQSWTPGDGKLIFGKNAQIPISGFLTGSNVAEIEWDGGSHILKKTSVLTKVQLNGTPISNPTALNDGDLIVIQKIKFHYSILDK
jgi:pSer/pThr/pTyr-binding forkhead associated (FHA) protein